MTTATMDNNTQTAETNYLAIVLFFLEFYHLLAHTAVLLRLRMLPRRDLVRQKLYFLADTLTVFMTNFVYTGRLRWLAALQMCQHLFFVFTWNEHPYTKKVISWSSLDWNYSEYSKGWHWHLVLGTLFDTMVHAVNSYILSLYITQEAMMATMFIDTFAMVLLLFNARFAWSSPGKVPKWVEKRVAPVKDEKYGSAMEVSQIALFLGGVGLVYKSLF